MSRHKSSNESNPGVTKNINLRTAKFAVVNQKYIQLFTFIGTYLGSLLTKWVISIWN